MSIPSSRAVWLPLACVLIGIGNPAQAGDPNSRSALRPFVVYDADDKPVGPFLPPNFVILAIKSERFAVALLRPGVSPTYEYAKSSVMFTTDDCSGVPYGSFYEIGPLTAPRAIVAFHNNEFKAYPNDGVFTEIDMRSSRDVTGKCRPGVLDRVPAVALGSSIKLSSRYRLPLHVK